MNKFDRVKALVMNRIVEIRTKQGLSQADVAKQAKIHPRAYNRIEREPQNLTLETLVAIADALDCEMTDLLPKTRKQPAPAPVKAKFGTTGEALSYAIAVLDSYKSLSESSF